MRPLAPLVALAALASCGPAPADDASPRPAAAPAAEGTASPGVVSATTRFAVEIYGRLRRQEGNLALSPASLVLALAMTHAGARGETAHQMAATLHLDAVEREDLDAQFETLLAQWNDPSRETYELRVANRLFGDRSTAFRDAFLELTGARYGARLEILDFRGAPEESRGRINAWVEEMTRRRIRDLLPPGSISPGTRLTLANAIYFKGRWKRRFEESETRTLPFHRGPSDAVPVPTMSQEGRFGYGEAPGVRVLRMPYAGDEIAMFAILPDRIDGLEEIESGLDARGLEAWIEGVRERQVRVWLPRFTIDPESPMDVKEALRGMGMTLPFEEEADLGGMSEARPLFIHGVFHKAFVEVNEEGTEAAAATGITVGVTSALPSEPAAFRADHPFLFAIRDLRSGVILFLGRVSDPSA